MTALPLELFTLTVGFIIAVHLLLTVLDFLGKIKFKRPFYQNKKNNKIN